MFKKNQLPYIIITITIICFNIIIISFPNSIISSTKNALLLWFNNVIPSLYPFIILNTILKEMNGFKILGSITKPITKILFKHNESGGVAFISGITSGYPLGGLVTANLLEKKLISLKEANYFIMFTNNVGPLFVVGTIGVTLFNNTQIGYFLLLNNIISSIMLGVLLSFFKKKQDKFSSCNNLLNISNEEKNKNLLFAISNSVISANETILIIGGFIMFYSIILNILEATKILNIFVDTTMLLIPFINGIQAKSIIYGFFEMTSGINLLSKNICDLQLDLTIINGILAFGGLSIHGQTLYGVLKTKIKVKNYFIGKFLHTIICMILTYISYNFVSFQESVPVFANSTLPFYYNKNYIYTFYITFFILLFISVLLKKKHKH